jgi:hypothetical protein
MRATQCVPQLPRVVTTSTLLCMSFMMHHQTMPLRAKTKLQTEAPHRTADCTPLNRLFYQLQFQQYTSTRTAPSRYPGRVLHCQRPLRTRGGCWAAAAAAITVQPQQYGTQHMACCVPAGPRYPDTPCSTSLMTWQVRKQYTNSVAMTH